MKPAKNRQKNSASVHSNFDTFDSGSSGTGTKTRRRLLAKVSPPFPLRYAEHVEGSGTALFQRVCELDLEGIVAKQKFGPYVTEQEHSTRFKILNREYSPGACCGLAFVRDSLCGIGIVKRIRLSLLFSRAFVKYVQPR